MTNEKQNLMRLLALEPLVSDPMPFPDFLLKLKEHPEWVDTAASRFVRAVKDEGEVDCEKLPASQFHRKPYLDNLEAMRVPNYSVFDHVRGAQRVVARLMKHYEAAAQNGYQLRQMLVIWGPPGSGKSFLVDAIIEALEGATVYAVSGCPVNENPINLLTLLKPEQLEALAPELGLGDKLFDLMKVAQQPCAHCFQQVMGQNHKGEETGDKCCGKSDSGNAADSAQPNLGNIQVVALRLSSRNAGISVWQPSPQGQGCTLLSALKQGSRGISRLQEAFAATDAEPGSVNELQCLLEATEGRRISVGSCGSITGFIPFDGLIIAETNEGGWQQFINNQPDPAAFVRRARVITMLYNTIISEEVQAYRDFIAKLKAVPEMDPLALRMAATLAVASRMVEDGEVQPNLITRMRMYDGEQLTVPKSSSSIRGNRSASSGYGSYSSIDHGAASTKKGSSSDPEGKNYTVDELWKQVEDKEGKTGLNMGFMLSCVSQICELGLANGHKCVTALGVISYLRSKIEQHSQTPGISKEEESMLDRCSEYLKAPYSTDDEAGLVEKEYRRLLRKQLLQVFAPDFEARASELFDNYWKHADAYAQGKKTFEDKKLKREVRVDTTLLDDLDHWRGSSSSTEREQFRGSITATVNNIIRSTAKANEAEGGEEHQVEISWRTIPELAKAIQLKLDDDIAKKVERCLTMAVGDLNESEQGMRERAYQSFKDLGYSEHCLKQMLAYCKDHQLWK